MDGVSSDRSQIVRLVAVVCCVGLTSIIGWGTSFSAVAVLGSIIARDLGFSREIAFGGITVMLLASGVVAPWCGRLIDRKGPRRAMAFGSAIGAVGLSLMAHASGVVSYLLAWAIFGLAVPLALSNASVTAIAQAAGPYARQGVTGLTIIAGITSLLFLPLTAALDARYGWRATLALYALMHIAICLPIHLAALPDAAPPDAAPQRSGSASTAASSWDGTLPEPLRRRAFMLIVLWSCFEGMLVWGFNMQAIDLLRDIGLAPAAAIGVWMLSGPSQSAARIIEFSLSGRVPVIATAIASAALAPVGFALFVALGVDVRSASIMAVCYGVGHGLFAIARNVLPIRLFGLRTLGETMGRMSLPQNIFNAAAPLVFAVVLDRYGAWVGLAVAGVCALASLVSVLLLYRMVQRAGLAV